VLGKPAQMIRGKIRYAAEPGWKQMRYGRIWEFRGGLTACGLETLDRNGSSLCVVTPYDRIARISFCAGSGWNWNSHLWSDINDQSITRSQEDQVEREELVESRWAIAARLPVHRA
jgi:hypothetical protein